MEDAARRAIAIVGVGAILPDAPDAGAFWRNVVESQYSIGEVDPTRWDPERYYDADPAAPDKTYSKIGGFVREWEWEPLQWRLPIPPKVADSMDVAQKWAVACARAALLDYGHPERDLDLQRTACVIGNAMAGELHYATALRIQFPEYAAALAQAPNFAALPADVREQITAQWRERIGEAFPPITEDTMPGELANCMAGRVANLFDLHGPNFVVDAACASALAAIDAAAEGLVENEYDAVIAGGVDRNMGASTYVKFCKIGALSATGTRPYADGADGFVMGEGAAFFVLKRLADAEQHGDRIYAVLRGMGGSSDGRGKGITAPNPAGQQIAIRRGWRMAGVDPASVGLVEGHGTSTRVGDVVEVQSLNEFFGGLGLRNASVPLGSVKSNFGHLKGAAGAAGILKAALALHEKVLPPSLNCQTPNPNLDWSATPFFVNTETKPWDAPAGGVRTACVSAFGFGGTNFHAVLEEHVPGRLTQRAASVSVPEVVESTIVDVSELKAPLRGALVLGAATPAELRSKLDDVLREAKAGRAQAPAPPREQDLRAAERLTLDYADAAELATRAERAVKALDADQPAVWRAVRAQGIHRGSGEAPRVAFLYTGQGSQYANMLRDLREQEPIVEETFAEADRVMQPLLDRPLSEYIFVDPNDEDAVKQANADLRRTEITQPAVLTVDAALTRLMASYGITPDMVMGHSLGEYGALVASGALPFEDALLAVSARGRGMANLEIPDVGKMAAIFGPLEQVEEVLAGIEGNVVIANINSRTQAVIGGASDPVDAAVAAFEKREMKAVMLPVSHAFHTTIVAPASEPLREALQELRLAPPEIPLVGNVTGEFYPTGPGAVPQMLDLLAAQVASPVQFVKGLETLYDAGARVIVEVGPKSALHGFAGDVLGDKPDVATLFTNHPKVGDAASFNQALCGLYAAGRGLAVGRPETARSTAAPANAASAAPVQASAAGLTQDRYVELGRLFADVLERGAQLLGSEVPESATGEPPVVTGASLGLPGHDKVFDDDNVRRILDGEQGIDVIPSRFRRAMVDKHIVRLVKSESEGAHFETIAGPEEAIKLAARAGAFDLVEEFGIPAERDQALDTTTRLAIGAGLEALRDAGVPLTMHFRVTRKGTKIPERWMLPAALRDETAVIFASAFPGADAFADELTRYHENHFRHRELEMLQSLQARVDEGTDGGEVMRAELEHRIHTVRDEIAANPFDFDRRFLFRVLAMGHSQFAEYIGARGPNTQINSACASTTQAFALAEDWIRCGRARRVVVIAGDDVTTDTLLEWIGAGFLSTGAAATDEVVEEAALPFDRRRHGMILGMGAAGFVIEHPDCARERGLRPICEVLSTVTANSAFHGTRLDVSHIQQVMEELIARAERRFGLDRREMAREMMFMSHETYTPARGGSASAEVNALRSVFGDAADAIVVANTKGLTGHPMGVGLEDAVAVKALETGLVPPVPNYREPDPDLGPLHLSKGGAYPVRYALRLGAGFGSQISLSLMRWVPTPDAHRPDPDELGYASRLIDRNRWAAWLREVSGDDSAEVEVVNRTLRVVDRSRAGRSAERPPPPPLEPPMVKQAGVPLAVQPKPAAPAPDAPVAAPAAADPDAAIRERVLAIVAEQTGYPSDMLDLDLDLEADLGVDTVKQAETFAAIREAYDIPRDENLKLRDYPTLAHTIQFVKDRAPNLPATPVAATPEPVAESTAAPTAPAAADPDAAIRERVLAIVAEKTGYPSDMLDLDLDLEADLGVDTVKQAETFAAIREAYDIPRDENLKLRDYPTLAHTIQFVKDRAPNLPAASPAPGAAATESPAAPAASTRDSDAAIQERVLAIVAEKTGYPSDMLDLDLDLEADLGVDTVKQAETFAAIREAYDIPRDENLKLRDYPTLAHTIQFVKDRAPGLAAPGSGAPVGDPDAAIRERVLAIVAEKTGYPSDMLDLDLDLEADLGVDTVKQAETFAAIREAYDIPRDENLKLRDYPTLAHTIQFVKDRAPGLAAAAPAAAAEAPAASAEVADGTPAAGSASPGGDLEAAAAVLRRVPVPVLRPHLDACRASGVELGEGARVVLMPDAGGVAGALTKRLEERGVCVLTLEPNEDAEALLGRLEGWLAEGPIRGIYWLPALDVEADLGDLDLASWRAALRLRVKLLYTTARRLYDALAEPGSFLVSATRLGGLHGYGEDGATAPLGGSVVGFTKAVSRERPDALIKAVDFTPSRRTAAIADAIVAETLADPGAVEVGRRDDERWSVALVEEEHAEGEGGLELGPERVFVVTGAAGGIVSAIIADLAGAGGGTFHLLDVVPEPDESDPDLELFAEDREALQRRIFDRLREAGQRGTPVEVGREMAGIERAHSALSALRAVRAGGGRAFWHAVDLTDQDAVAKAVESVLAESPHVDVLLHAAGLERSRALSDKDPSEFDLVFDVKSDGWFNLMRALGDSPPGATVGFSSIAGRFGNAGQTDYSAANDLLCKQTSSLRRTHPDTRGIAIDWTAWGDLGMATRGSIPEIMERAGIDMLPAAAGIPIVRQELTSGRRGEVLIGGRLGVLLQERDPQGGLDVEAAAAAGPLAQNLSCACIHSGVTASTRLDPAGQPFLDHHRIDGTAVLPGVMGLEAFAELATAYGHGRHVVAIEDVRFLAPFKFYRDEPRDIEVTARLERAGDDVLARCTLLGSRTLAGQSDAQVTTHFSACVRLGAEPWEGAQSVAHNGAPDGAVHAADIYRVYFHGPAFQVLEAAWRDGETAIGLLRETLHDCLDPPGAALVAAPRLVELCFQAAGVWEIGTSGRMGLPQRIERVRIAPDAAEGPGPRHAVVKPLGDGSFDVQVVDAGGRVLVQLEGYATALLPDAVPDEARAPLAEAMS